MLTPYFCQATLDDLLRDAIEAVRDYGRSVTASRGPCLEITGVLLELTNVRARLSRTETKGTPFSSLGEFCWYLSGRSDFPSIAYYLPTAYDLTKDVEPDGVTISGAYGPRLMGVDGNGQLEQVLGLLGRRESTRRAVLQLFDAEDLRSGQRDVPCTCTIQLLNRDGRLEMVTYMRSNDVLRGLPHDIFCFTMLQEWIARRLRIDVGTYKHAVGSLHLYQDRKDVERAQRFLDEGFQATQSPMPPMPVEDPQGALAALLDAEEALRADPADYDRASAHERALDGYWADLVRLLRAFRHWKERDAEAICRVRGQMVSPIYQDVLLRRAQSASDRPAR